jgi:tetratricopeptide (TPR) repeat protein
MRLKIVVLGAASALALAPVVNAPAAESSSSVLRGDPDSLQRCADAAATAVAGRVAPAGSLGYCDTAVEISTYRRDELAAAYVNRSVLRLAAGQYEGALADSDAAIHIKSIIPQAHINRGIALSAEKRNKEAVQAFSNALALDPSHPEIVYFDRAMAREDSGDAKGAYLDYRKAAQLAPTWDTPKQQLARFTVGHAPTS